MFASKTLVAAILTGSALAYHGRMTHYSPSQGLSACGQQYSENDFIAAVSFDHFGNGNPNDDTICGKTATITYDGKTQTIKVEDKCAGCGTDDIDVSPAVFRFFDNLDVGVLEVDWNIE